MATTLYWLFVEGYADKGHLLQGIQRDIYGPIWRSRFGPFDMVNVASPELISQVIHQEGRYPVRTELPHWKEYRDLRGQAYGLHVNSGPEWSRLRGALNPKMLKLHEVSTFAAVINEVVDDLLKRFELLRGRSEDGSTVSDVASEFYKFGFEGISAILFETRLGCLQEDVPEDIMQFINAINNMFTLSELVVLLPRWSRTFLPLWKRFFQAWDDLSGVAQMLIDRRVAEIAVCVQSGEPVEGLYLSHLLSSDHMTRAEVYTCITELLLGGVDTTSNTLSWALYRLAKDAAVQRRLHDEVTSTCPDGRTPTMDDLSAMPYLKAVIKETLRLYPVVPGNARFITDKEVVLGNYRFPKKTLFHLCHYTVLHDEAQFEAAGSFAPHRWLRPERPRTGFYNHHPYSFIPFGVGVRGCVGKRLAEMEMHFALARLMQHYEVRLPDGAAVVEPKTRTLLIPDRPINLHFLPRT